MPRFITAATCAALALSLGACGDSDSKDDSSSTPPPAAHTSAAAPSGASVSVGIKDIKFVPATFTAKVGQKIVWTNNEAVVHNVTATKGADFASDSLSENATFEYTPKKAGTIDYVCTIHSGQSGSITVTK
jgi:plastocyanin